MQIDLLELTLLQDINKKLVSGYHISEQDVQLWQQLDQYQDEYAALFSGLGYRLKHDARGYFYIDADDSTVNMGKISRAMAVTIYVLIEYYADNGFDPLRALFEKVITEEIMQQVVQNQYHLFEQLEITSAAELKRDVFNRMLRNGFATETQSFEEHDLGQMGFKLLAPVYRYLDALDEIQPHESIKQPAPTPGQTELTGAEFDE
ncbi:condensin complex protein MksE [Algibacillus agarilyticus]|uniref:condensin complex protein MksE n=1 Tax=Algibacillus agarilyticus TaxID=2234133 RepID=UPI003F6A1442